MTESIDKCFKGPPGSIGKAKPKVTLGQLGSREVLVTREWVILDFPQHRLSSLSASHKMRLVRRR